MPAALLGLFGAGENAGIVTTGSRTSTAGSLITVACGTFNAPTAICSTPTDSFGNAYTEQLEVSAGADTTASLAYTLPTTTRGAAHTISKADDGSGNSIGGQEWSGIETAPTIASASATGTSQDPSASVAVSAASLAVLVYLYSGAATTFDDAGGSVDGTPGQEIDENSDQQAVCVRYKVGQTGTPSITGRLGASRVWGAAIVTFTEAAAGGDTLFAQSVM